MSRHKLCVCTATILVVIIVWHRTLTIPYIQLQRRQSSQVHRGRPANDGSWGTTRANASSEERARLEAGCELAGLDSNDEALLRVTLAELRKAKVPHFGAGGSTLGALRFGSTRMRWHGLDMGTIDLDVDLIAYFPTDSARSRFFSGLKARFAADAEFECIPCCGSTTSPSECSAIYWRGKTSADSWGTGAHQTALHHRTDQDQKYYDAHSRLLTNLHHVGRSDRVLDALQVLICIGWLQIYSLRPRSTRRILWSTGRHNILYL